MLRPIPKRPRTAPPRRLEILHRTTYRYEKAVERSTHLLRFEPMTDRLQRLARHELRVSVEGKWRDYTDVFGNRARRLVLDVPFKELVDPVTLTTEVRFIEQGSDYQRLARELETRIPAKK